LILTVRPLEVALNTESERFVYGSFQVCPASRAGEKKLLSLGV
jgi:hypothetical protein